MRKEKLQQKRAEIAARLVPLAKIGLAQAYENLISDLETAALADFKAKNEGAEPNEAQRQKMIADCKKTADGKREKLEADAATLLQQARQIYRERMNARRARRRLIIVAVVLLIIAGFVGYAMKAYGDAPPRPTPAEQGAAQREKDQAEAAEKEKKPADGGTDCPCPDDKKTTTSSTKGEPS